MQTITLFTGEVTGFKKIGENQVCPINTRTGKLLKKYGSYFRRGGEAVPKFKMVCILLY